MKSAPRRIVTRSAWAAVLALAAWAAGAFPESLVLERSALEHGELWRLWTGHLVHGSAPHFAYDVAAAVLLCLVFGPALRLLWMAPLIGLGLLAALPDVQHYYGLSALLHAWVVAIAAHRFLDESRPRRWLAAAVLLGTIGKAALETSLGRSVFTPDIDFGGPVLHASHLVGALVGLAVAVLTWVRSRNSSNGAESLPSATAFVALVDCLSYRSGTLTIDAESQRLKGAKERDEARRWPRGASRKEVGRLVPPT